MDKERYTTFYIIKNFTIFSFILILTVLVLSLVMGCHSIPQDAISQQERFIRNHPLWKEQASEILQDRRNIRHEYKVVFPTLDNGENIIIYCATHFVWEIITAKYNGEHRKYDYFVVEHPKN